MEYISVEEFLKQPKEVQKIFLDWWQPNIGDLYARINTKHLPHLVWKFEDDCILSNCENFWEEKYKCIPLLTEGQLRQFIEYKTGCKTTLVQAISLPIEIWLISENNTKRISSINKFNVIEAYWKIALEIINKELSSK